ncbi:MAG: amylo-alpha-1,6-glucosidase, partial [Vicinamibacterales bacterium]
IPVIIAGSVNGQRDAEAAYRRLLAGARELYKKNVRYYDELLGETTEIQVPDARLTRAFAWATVGVDKGFATNPFLGTGLVAGFRTSGASERPGFAWYFGRDSMWTVPAMTSTGNFAGARATLEFLRKYQRKDGKIPHEISQSATLVPWFTDYPYAWASADATPLYVMAHADYWNATGDREFLAASWDSIVRAYRYTAGTDSDGNGLPENTNVGHGWVEGGALYPPHEEIYMQGIWIEATRRLADLARVMRDAALAAEARQISERTREITEKTYWLPQRHGYAFATKRPQTRPSPAEPGPGRDRRQRRLDALAGATLVDEDTVLPAVALWWGALAEPRAQQQIDRLGAGDLATDWGARILSAQSELYDPLSYHYGSVWPLFTGWVSMAAYRYGRPHVGYQALMANALLTESGALGYVTELLSGDFNAAFGRSSHHQIWSEAMVVTPLMRGLMGISVEEGGAVLRFAPQVPVDWDRMAVKRVAAGPGHYDLELRRGRGEMRVAVERTPQPSGPSLERVIVAPAFPLDATVRAVHVNGRKTAFAVQRIGDVQRAEVVIERPAPTTDVRFEHTEGTDVWRTIERPRPGASNEGLRILRSRADRDALRLTLEGLGGRTYPLRVRSARRPGPTDGVRIAASAGDPELLVTFEGPADRYVRREIVIPLRD